MIAQTDTLRSLLLGHQQKVISFDVFDTLLIRAADPPESTKTIAAARAVSMLGLSQTADELLKVRLQCEKELRSQARENGWDPECSIEEIFARVVERLLLDQRLKDDLIALEMEVEQALVAPMPHMQALLRDLSKSCRLIAISDSYLSSIQIKKLLDAAGLGGYLSCVYSSCDHKMGKGSGRLFGRVLSLEGVDKAMVLHVGDNFLSDYFVPRASGIHSILLHDSWNIRRKQFLRLLSRKEQTSAFWKGYSLLYPIISNNEGKDNGLPEGAEAYYRWGRNVVGPLLVLFVHILTEELGRSRFKRAFFIARDGYLLKRLYSLFSEELWSNRLPPAVYLLTSRYAAFIASLTSLEERESRYALWGARVSVGDALKRLGVFDVMTTQTLLGKHGLDAAMIVSGEVLKNRLTGLLSDPAFRDLVAENSAKMRDLLHDYLVQCGFLSEKHEVCLVDVGWTGTIQECLEHTFGDSPGFPRLTGYYLAMNPPIIDTKGRRRGLLYDYRAAYPEEMSIALFREALEFSTRAFHGTTTGYRRVAGNKIIPCLRSDTNDRNKEQETNRNISLIHRGVLEFARDYIRMVKARGIRPEETKAFVLKWYDANVSFPAKADVEAFGRVVNTDDFGSQNARGIISTIERRSLVRPGKALHSFLDTPWREASLLRAGIPFLTTCYYLTKRLVCWQRITRYQSDEPNTI